MTKPKTITVKIKTEFLDSVFNELLKDKGISLRKRPRLYMVK